MTAATPRRRRAAAIARGLAAGAGIVCDVLAPAAGVVFAVRFGTFVAHNTSVIAAFIAAAFGATTPDAAREPLRQGRLERA